MPADHEPGSRLAEMLAVQNDRRESRVSIISVSLHPLAVNHDPGSRQSEGGFGRELSPYQAAGVLRASLRRAKL
jgi:hypothetical protein